MTLKESSPKYLNNLKFYKIEFHTPYAGELDSIKLYGALLSAMKALYPERFSDFYEAIKKGEVAVSSFFPVWQDELLFFKPNLPADLDLDDRKGFKRVKYIPADMVKNAINNGKFEKEDVREIVYWAGDEENKRKLKNTKMLVEEDIPKVSISRMGGSNIFYEHVVYLLGKWGFIVREGKFASEINTCLRYLSDRGISKKSTWGLGKFQIDEKKDFSWRISSEEYAYLVSKYAPGIGEINHIDFESSYYNIKTVVGKTRAGTSFRQRCITEGSVLKLNKYELKGKVVEVKSEDYVYSAWFTPLFV